MTVSEFNTQMKRLADTFGSSQMQQERLSLIFQKVRFFTEEWFKYVVDQLLRSSRAAPLPADFDSFISSERERTWIKEKRDRANEANTFWSGAENPEDVKMKMDAIKARVRGELTDAEWETFMSLIEAGVKKSG